ncbi:MAG: VOC family protein [Candidatus Hydrogenedentota bacterium]
MQTITSCLWFDNQAEDAALFYTSIIKNSKMGTISRYGETGPMSAGTVLTVTFQLDGQEFMALNGGPHYKLSPAYSIVIHCETQDEIDHHWDRLAEGGQIQQCGWLVDRFGLSWQVVPARLGEWISDPGKGNAVMARVLQMKKLDIAPLQKAYDEA